MTTVRNANDAARERGGLAVVLAAVAINVVAVSLLPFAPWSAWRTGAALNFADNFLLIRFVLCGGILAHCCRRRCVGAGLSIFVCCAMAFFLTDRLVS